MGGREGRMREGQREWGGGTSCGSATLAAELLAPWLQAHGGGGSGAQSNRLPTGHTRGGCSGRANNTGGGGGWAALGGASRGGGSGGGSFGAAGGSANLLELRRRPNQGFGDASSAVGSSGSGTGAAGGSAVSSRYGRSNHARGMCVRAGKIATNSGKVGRPAGSSGTRLHCNSSRMVCLTSRCFCAEKPFASNA